MKDFTEAQLDIINQAVAVLSAKSNRSGRSLADIFPAQNATKYNRNWNEREFTAQLVKWFLSMYVGFKDKFFSAWNFGYGGDEVEGYHTNAALDLALLYMNYKSSVEARWATGTVADDILGDSYLGTDLFYYRGYRVLYKFVKEDRTNRTIGVVYGLNSLYLNTLAQYKGVTDKWWINDKFYYPRNIYANIVSDSTMQPQLLMRIYSTNPVYNRFTQLNENASRIIDMDEATEELARSLPVRTIKNDSIVLFPAVRRWGYSSDLEYRDWDFPQQYCVSFDWPYLFTQYAPSNGELTLTDWRNDDIRRNDDWRTPRNTGGSSSGDETGGSGSGSGSGGSGSGGSGTKKDQGNKDDGGSSKMPLLALAALGFLVLRR